MIKSYPAIPCSVILNQHAAAKGVTLGARRNGVMTQIWVPAVEFEPLTLHELLEAIHEEAERQLADQRDT